MLRTLPHLFPQVDIKYDPDTSSTTPIILHIRPHLDLLFSGKHQRLRTICLRKLRDPNPPVILHYKDTILSSPEEVLRRVGISRTFGPTYAGEDLRYPGLWFSFEEDGGNINHGKGNQQEDRMQEVKRVLISQKELEGGDALDEVVECPVMDGDVSLAVVKVYFIIRSSLVSSPRTRQHPNSSALLRSTMGLHSISTLPTQRHYTSGSGKPQHKTSKSSSDRHFG